MLEYDSLEPPVDRNYLCYYFALLTSTVHNVSERAKERLKPEQLYPHLDQWLKWLTQLQDVLSGQDKEEAEMVRRTVMWRRRREHLEHLSKIGLVRKTG